jgi:O-antigen/teichoic acid export membrane protein
MAAHSATAALQRRTIGVFTTNVIVLGIGYVASIVLARFLGADGRGLVAVIQTGASVLAGIGGIGTQEAATYYASRRSRRRGVVLGNGLAHAGVLLVVSVAVGFVAMGELQKHVAPAYDARIWLLAALLVPTFYVDVLVSNLLSAQGAFTLRNRLNLAGRITTAFATVAIVGWLGWGVAGALVATAPTLLLPAMGGLRVLARNGISFSRPVQVASLRYGARAQVGAMLNLLNARFDVLLLSAFVPLATVGTYAIAQIVAELVLLFPNAMGYVLRAQVASGSARDDSLSGAALRLNGTLVAGCVLGVLAVGPLMIIYGFGPEFHAALVPFFILLPGMWFLAAGVLVEDTLAGRGRPGLSSILASAEVVITIGLDLLLIPRYGAIGGAIGSVCAYTFYGTASLIMVARLDGVRTRTLLFANRDELRGLVTALRARSG